MNNLQNKYEIELKKELKERIEKGEITTNQARDIYNERRFWMLQYLQSLNDDTEVGQLKQKYSYIRFAYNNDTQVDEVYNINEADECIATYKKYVALFKDEDTSWCKVILKKVEQTITLSIEKEHYLKYLKAQIDMQQKNRTA